MKRKLLVISWGDIQSPTAGEAETLTHSVLRRLSQEFKVSVLCPTFVKCDSREVVNCVSYIRLGKKRQNSKTVFNLSMYLSVFQYYWKQIRGKKKYDIVIEQLNPFPFFYCLYANPNTILFIHRLCTADWFRTAPWYFSWIGYWFLEPIYLFLMREKTVITYSHTVKNRLLKFGFHADRVHVVPQELIYKPKQLYLHLLCILENMKTPEKKGYLRLRRFSYIK